MNNSLDFEETMADHGMCSLRKVFFQVCHLDVRWSTNRKCYTSLYWYYCLILITILDIHGIIVLMCIYTYCL